MGQKRECGKEGEKGKQKKEKRENLYIMGKHRS